MIVTVNGEEKEIAKSITLVELLARLELPPARIAIEVNHVVVRRLSWAETVLKENDQIEIVHFVGGG